MNPQNKYEFERALKFFQIPVPSDISEIKSKYRTLALKYHPDHSGDRSGNLFKILNDHYNILIDNFNIYLKAYPPPKPKPVFKGTKIYRVLDSKVLHHTLIIPEDLLDKQEATLFLMWGLREFIVKLNQDFDLSLTLQVGEIQISFKKEELY